MVKWTILSALIAMVGLELWALLVLGGLLGVGWTLAWVVISCVIGVWIVRWAGFRTLIRIHQKLREEVLPTTELMEMGIILMAGFFLVLPGFISDAAGLLLVLPPVRWVMRGLLYLVFGRLLPPPRGREDFKHPEGPTGETVEIVEIVETVEIKAKDIS